MATFKHVISLSLLLILPCEASSWYSKTQEGWLWYKQPPKKTVLKTKKKTSANNEEKKEKQDKKPLSYRAQIEKVRENFEEVQAKAILQPTLENVAAFQQAQNTVLNQADLFQKMLLMAEMLESQTTSLPAMSSPAAREITYQQEDRLLEQDIHHLTKSFGIFFLTKNDCPYCHQFAPIVRDFLDAYPFEFKVISKEGSVPSNEGLSEFPETVPDNGTIAKLNPEGVYPYLLLVNPSTHEVIPLAKGLINVSQLKENLKVIIHFLKTQGQ